ncbi:3-hydroxyacyl-CoA dehydrogenase NAD-binding domain-containing protein [Eubacteriales bacterium DFI.9.88]|nr:3-hydroxyacyl-CoA dehydrogenase NAD-binding domain-containing protein [Eubacteriales bacterium DFI.9.88]
MKAEDIKKILVIGAGTMAAHITTQFVLFGREVVVYVRSEDKKQVVLDRVRNEVMAPCIAEGYFTDEYADKAVKNISFIVGDPSLVPDDIGLVSESVYEDYETKEAVWKSFAPYLPKDAILTTDSSSLYPSRYAAASGAPERFLAWHFYMPSFYRNVTDISPVAETKQEYVDLLIEFAKSIHMNPCLLKKETPGYLANNMLYSFVDMGLTLYRTGAAGIEEIDRAWMGVRQEQTGPFGILDAAGIDTMYLILKEWYGTTKENLPILEEKLAKGELGVKTGKGFYTYPNPRHQDPDFLKRASKVE